MNANVIQDRVNKIINELGNSMSYNAPITTQGTTWYTDEGDWKKIYAGTTVTTKWIESEQISSSEVQNLGLFNVGKDEAIVKGTEAYTELGKCVSNSIDWEIEEVSPIRVQDVTVAQLLTLRKVLP